MTLAQKLESLLFGSRRLFHNARIDLKYGAFLGGTIKSSYAHLGIQDVANTDYAVLPFIFKDKVRESDVLVDIGCGKGRVINWWLSCGLPNQIIGIELDEAVARRTQQRLRRYENVKIICGDALNHLPENATVLYLYNPFTAPWVAKLKDRLKVVYAAAHKITLLYYNCIFVEIFVNDPNWTVEVISLGAPFHPLAVVRFRNESSIECESSELRTDCRSASSLSRD